MNIDELFSVSVNSLGKIDVTGHLEKIARQMKYIASEEVDNAWLRVLHQWSGKKKVYGANRVYNATEKNAYYTVSNNGKTLNLTVERWFNVDLMPMVKDADEWVKKWSDEFSGEPGWEELPSNEYKANLIFDEGIIGLPKQSHFRKKEDGSPFWVNPDKTVFEPLNKVIERESTSGKLTSDYIGELVFKKLKLK